MFEALVKEYKVKDYLILFSLLVIGFGLFFFFDYHRPAQQLVVILTAMVYVLWGIAHHGLQKDLHPRVVLEYLLVAFLASLVTLFLLSRT
jgi:ABC-type iron transport system FetAB permease component